MVDVDVWADVRCPWCWIGLRRLRRVAAHLDQPVQVRRRSFLLEPHGPASPGLTTARVATSEWGMTVAQWEAKSQHISDEGLREGLDIDVNGALMFDSNPVHRLLKLAAATAAVDTDAAWEAVFNAHFSRHEDLGDSGVLRALGASWGFDDTEIERALDDEGFAAEIDGDLDEARHLAVGSVPTIVADDGRRISGTVGVDDLVRFLTPTGATA